jgi:uncharacterized protein YbjT (DUF2867 family)
MNSISHTAVIAGSTGLVGMALLQQLLNGFRYDKIIILVRKSTGLRHPKLEERIIDFDQLDAGIGPVAAEDWYCTLGTTRKQAGSREAFRKVDHDYPVALARLALESGAERFLLVTAMGASEHSLFFYNRVKGETERDLASLGLPELHLFRPSLLLGERRERRGGEALAAFIMKAMRPLLIGPLRKYRGIPAEQVANAMWISAARERPGMQIVENDKIAELAAQVR